MKYIEKFNKHSQYESYIEGSDKVLPNVSYCWDNNEVHYNPKKYEDMYLTFTALQDGTFSFSQNDLQYSLDGGETWETLTAGTSTPTINTGEEIMWKCENPQGWTGYGIGKFSSTGNFNARGNVMSLLHGDNFKEQVELTTTDIFTELFSGSEVVSAKKLKLPATTLASYCYASMFQNCTSLTTAPELPATTLADSCYYYMFSGCTSLTTAPELPATTLASYCYSYMFYSCTSLTTAPELPATTLAYSCYAYMFRGCTSLTAAPELPAITLDNYCYTHMFYSCTSLTTAPSLPATTLANYCYYYMFYGCTSLTTAPSLPATTLANYCYQNMFRSCTSLTSAPELPATTLATYCYSNMFRGCTSLTAAPELPATTLSLYCYNFMFNGCTSLNHIKAMFITTPSGSYTSSWVNNVASSGTFVKNSAATWDVTGSSGIPSGWTVETASE